MKTKIYDIFNLLDRTMCVQCKLNIDGLVSHKCKCSYYLKAADGIVDFMREMLEILPQVAKEVVEEIKC